MFLRLNKTRFIICKEPNKKEILERKPSIEGEILCLGLSPISSFSLIQAPNEVFNFLNELNLSQARAFD